MASAMTSSAALVRPFTPVRVPTAQKPGNARTALRVSRVVVAAEPKRTGMSEGREGVLPGLKNWPPKPITEHGQPKPEDDPTNQAPEPGQVQGYRRVDGPSDEEVAEKKKKMREESPWSNPNREGGTQAGGGGEGSAA